MTFLKFIIAPAAFVLGILLLAYPQVFTPFFSAITHWIFRGVALTS